MPYTLAKFFVWGLLMALAGGIVGWLLRSLKARFDGPDSRTPSTDDAETEQLRRELADLKEVAAERDRLRMELADVRGSSAGALGFAGLEGTSNVERDVAATAAAPTASATATDGPQLIGGESDRPDVTASSVDGAASSGTESAVDEPTAPSDDAVGAAPVELDLAAARSTLGKRVVLDDLTVVEGIGPKIAELCRGIGVTTWSELATTDVEMLQSMLDAAGSRFQMHRPGTWPQQAALLAEGRWAEFVELTDSLSGGA